ncbi:hypothetical protein B0H17DRAFT_1337526, partial [Mycena rosella]
GAVWAVPAPAGGVRLSVSSAVPPLRLIGTALGFAVPPFPIRSLFPIPRSFLRLRPPVLSCSPRSASACVSVSASAPLVLPAPLVPRPWRLFPSSSIGSLSFFLAALFLFPISTAPRAPFSPALRAPCPVHGLSLTSPSRPSRPTAHRPLVLLFARLDRRHPRFRIPVGVVLLNLSAVTRAPILVAGAFLPVAGAFLTGAFPAHTHPPSTRARRPSPVAHYSPVARHLRARSTLPSLPHLLATLHPYLLPYPIRARSFPA